MMRTIAALVFAALTLLSAVPASADAVGDVRAVMLKFAALSSYEMAVNTPRGSSTIEIAKPNSSRIQGGGMEMVHVGSMAYIKMPGRGWMKIEGSRAGVGPHQKYDDRLREMIGKPNAFKATDLGMKNVGGETLHAYRCTNNKGSTTIIYAGGDGLPHAFEAEGRTLVRVRKFNAVAPIRPPI